MFRVYMHTLTASISIALFKVTLFVQQGIFMSPPFEEWCRGIKCYPCPCVRPSVRALSNFGVRSITFVKFKFGMMIYNIKTQVEIDLGYNALIFDRVMGLLLKHSTQIGVRSITLERLHRFHLYLEC